MVPRLAKKANQRFQKLHQCCFDTANEDYEQNLYELRRYVFGPKSDNAKVVKGKIK
jgi:hypothetical protein